MKVSIYIKLYYKFDNLVIIHIIIIVLFDNVRIYFEITDELADFNKKWTHPIKDNTDGQNSNRFPWYKFFGPGSKL